MCSELIKVHKIQIITNNRTYHSSKDKLIRNIIVQNDVLLLPKWVDYVKEANEKNQSMLNNSFNNRNSKKPLKLQKGEVLPSKELIKELYDTLKEGFEYFQQVKRYSSNPNSYIFKGTEKSMKDRLEKIESQFEEFKINFGELLDSDFNAFGCECGRNEI